MRHMRGKKFVAVCWGGGVWTLKELGSWWGGGAQEAWREGTFCLQVWESVVSAGWRWWVEGSTVIPSAGKQCQGESVLWLVLDSDFFCSASEPRSCRALFIHLPQKKRPSPLPKDTHQSHAPLTTRSSGLTGVHSRLPEASPEDTIVTNQLIDREMQVWLCH